MQDLEVGGFSKILKDTSYSQVKPVIRWLAAFHAFYLNKPTDGLWERGSYWHLDTRPDELEKLEESALKVCASLIDAQLNSAKYKTVVHGDAKLANFVSARLSF